MRSVLSFDYGGSTGRAVLCHYDGEQLELAEVHCFPNEPFTENGTLFWNFETLFAQMCLGIQKAQEICEFESIGVDTWGVDFGLLDANGTLLEPPVHYRDSRTDGLSAEVCSIVGEHALYEMTGTQRMDINTLYQLYALQKYRPDFLQKAHCLLLMPDLFAYLLTDNCHAELTIASSTQMLDLYHKVWNRPLLEKLGLPYQLLPTLVEPGTQAGTLKQELCRKLGVTAVPVIAVAAHDTASAVLSVPAQERDFIFISCGTWSLFGTELSEPIIDAQSQAYNLTNELGFGGTVTLLKNIIGLWLIQETRRQFRREGRAYTYARMETMARVCRPFACFIDPGRSEFVPAGNIPETIRTFCQETGQVVPQTDGEVVRCIYESLALNYRHTFDQIRSCTGRRYRSVYIVGGGAKDALLCQMTANAIGLPVIAGPIEATAMGNAAAQLLALGVFSDAKEVRAAVRRSFQPAVYQPEETERWTCIYEKVSRLFA